MEKTKVELSGIMVDLDVLTDTRLAVLQTFNADIFKTPFDYLNRPMDQYPGIGLDAFREIYDRRDKTILKAALSTPVLKMVVEFCKDTALNSHQTPFKKKPVVYVNTHPYDLDDSEIDVILRAIVSATKNVADVYMVCMDASEITPTWVKEHLSILVMYDYDLWLECHAKSKAFKTVSCPEVGLLGPMIFFKEPQGISIKNPFIAVEQISAPMISLKLMPIEFFSVDPSHVPCVT